MIVLLLITSNLFSSGKFSMGNLIQYCNLAAWQRGSRKVTSHEDLDVRWEVGC